MDPGTEAPPVSRQRISQLRKINEGTCLMCDFPATEGQHCADHAEEQRARKRDAYSKRAKCRRCKRRGHIALECPFRTCSKCGSKGHADSRCPKEATGG